MVLSRFRILEMIIEMGYWHVADSKTGDLSRKEWLDKCSRYIKKMWPCWIPWEVNTVWSMPIVLWLSKPRGRKHDRR